MLIASALVGFLGVMLEGVQAVSAAHTCSARDALVAVLGAMLGACGAANLVTVAPPDPGAGAVENVLHCRRRAPRVRDERLRMVVFAGLVVASAYVLATGLWGLGGATAVRVEPAVYWIPLHAHFHAPLATTLTDLVEQLALYAAITLLCLFLTRGRGPAIALLLLLGLLIALEIGRALLAEQAADTTAPLLAVLAWVVTLRVWRALYPGPAQRMVRVRATHADT
jgi:hypothetical protein